MWGVLNVTPDSFSDGGLFYDRTAAVEHGLSLVEAGASVVDVGGESTRPPGNAYGEGYSSVSLKEELRRVIPTIADLAQSDVVVSVDTTKAEVAEQALSAGACIVNDVSCARNVRLLRTVAAHGAHLVVMHNRGRGECQGMNVRYGQVEVEVHAELMEAVQRATNVGVDPRNIVIDPGVGFAKTSTQSLQLLARIDILTKTGFPVLVGASRKSLIAEVARRGSEVPCVESRLGGSLALALLMAERGVSAVRVHDVFETHQALAVAEGLRDASSSKGRFPSVGSDR